MDLSMMGVVLIALINLRFNGKLQKGFLWVRRGEASVKSQVLCR